jgi:hypothetical protein
VIISLIAFSFTIGAIIFAIEATSSPKIFLDLSSIFGSSAKILVIIPSIGSSLSFGNFL